MRRVLFRFDDEASVAGRRSGPFALALDSIAVEAAVADDGRGRR